MKIHWPTPSRAPFRPEIKTRLCAGCALVLMIVAGSAARLIYVPETYDPLRSINGRISNYEGGVITVTTERGEERQFKIAYDTGIAIHGNTGNRGDLEVGMRVSVTPGSNSWEASSVIAERTPPPLPH